MGNLVYLACLLAVALLIIVRAFPKQVGKSAWGVALLSSVFLLFVVALYWHWGGWFAWQQEKTKQARAEQVQALIKQFKTPEALIQKLKQQLSDAPESARGWYLLGRLYSSQNDWKSARLAFQHATRLKPHQQRYQMNSIYALCRKDIVSKSYQSI